MEERLVRLALAQEEAAVCEECGLHKSRTKSVWSRGNAFGEIMFIGEAPGATEDEEGEPFVGDAGQLLNKMIAGMKLVEGDTYICNTVKCRPPSNRLPTSKEVSTCMPFLHIQIMNVEPRIIIALGKTAVKALGIEADKDWRGKWSSIEIRGKKYPVMATYHPAYLLREPDKKPDVGKDLGAVLKKLEKLRAKDKPAEPEDGRESQP